MIARLRAVLASDQLALALGGLVIGTGLKLINDVVKRRRTELVELDQLLEQRRAELAALEAPLSPAPAGSYPAREDLDPLHTGEDDRG